jgi:hypothetical protein
MESAGLFTAIGAGLSGAWALICYTKSILYGITPLDAPSFGLALVALLAAVLAATIGPARRASKVDPIRRSGKSNPRSRFLQRRRLEPPLGADGVRAASMHFRCSQSYRHRLTKTKPETMVRAGIPCLRVDRRPLGQSSDAARRRARFQTAMEEWRVTRPALCSSPGCRFYVTSKRGCGGCSRGDEPVVGRLCRSRFFSTFFKSCP